MKIGISSEPNIYLYSMKNKQKFNGFYESLPEFDAHNSVIFITNKKKNLRGYIAFHRGGFGSPSFGATRFWSYDGQGEALKDALRLSKLMSYKNALAGLPYGGAKAVLIKPKNGKYKKSELLREYARHLERLGGKFITGTDVGLDLGDITKMLKVTKNLVGFMNNPENATAFGLFYSIETAVKHINGSPSLKGVSFAIQGLGKVGSLILGMIYKDASKIYVADIDKKKLAEIKKKYPKVIIVSPDKIHKQEVDVFCPCALSGVLSSKTINDIKARAIVGSANNQLTHKAVGEILHRLGILYCPDYVVNAGGLIAVAHEYQKREKGNGTLREKLKQIGPRLDKILTMSKKTNKAPSTVADEIAEKILEGRY